MVLCNCRTLSGIPCLLVFRVIPMFLSFDSRAGIKVVHKQVVSLMLVLIPVPYQHHKTTRALKLLLFCTHRNTDQNLEYNLLDLQSTQYLDPHFVGLFRIYCQKWLWTSPSVHLWIAHEAVGNTVHIPYGCHHGYCESLGDHLNSPRPEWLHALIASNLLWAIMEWNKKLWTFSVPCLSIASNWVDTQQQ